jgi:ribosomal subunit interface protein
MIHGVFRGGIMQINISGKNMDTGVSFQEHAASALDEVVAKYFKNAISGNVTLEKSDSGFTVKTRVLLTRRVEMESKGHANDAHMALDAAIEHAEKRLRRHKRRLKNHRLAVTEIEEDEVYPAPMKIYAGSEQSPKFTDDQDGEALPIVAELEYAIEVLTVEQAVMKLELGNLTMLMFRNANHFGLNVVHLREDGTIGWIDPRGGRLLG